MATSPYMIGGGLSFGGAPGQDYNSAYAAALSLNSQNYSNILQGYSNLAQAQYQAQQPIQQGYNQLTQDVLSGIQDVGKSQNQDILDQYAQQSGQASQSMISRGLSNTTARDAVQRGLMLDKTKAQNNLQNQIAQLRAGYQSNLGSQALGYANTANMQNTALGQSQLGWMNSVNAGYPNAADYMRLAQMRGAAGVGVKPNGPVNPTLRQGSAGGGSSGQGSMMNARGFAPSLGYMTGYNPNNYAGMNTPKGSAAAYNGPPESLDFTGMLGGGTLGTSGAQESIPFGNDLDYNDIRNGGSGVKGGWTAEDEAQFQALEPAGIDYSRQQDFGAPNPYANLDAGPYDDYDSMAAYAGYD